MSPDLSYAINERALLHIDNAYYLPNIEVKNYLCKTNTSSSTAFRGFGGNQGMMAIENIIDNVARYLKKDPSEIRKINFYGQNKRNITHYGMKINDNVINEIFKNLKMNDKISWGKGDIRSKIYGIYENKIQQKLKDISKPILIDIGAADGFFAIGCLKSKICEYCYTFEETKKVEVTYI